MLQSAIIHFFVAGILAGFYWLPTFNLVNFLPDQLTDSGLIDRIGLKSLSRSPTQLLTLVNRFTALTKTQIPLFIIWFKRNAMLYISAFGEINSSVTKVITNGFTL